MSRKSKSYPKFINLEIDTIPIYIDRERVFKENQETGHQENQETEH